MAGPPLTWTAGSTREGDPLTGQHQPGIRGFPWRSKALSRDACLPPLLPMGTLCRGSSHLPVACPRPYSWHRQLYDPPFPRPPEAVVHPEPCRRESGLLSSTQQAGPPRRCWEAWRHQGLQVRGWEGISQGLAGAVAQHLLPLAAQAFAGGGGGASVCPVPSQAEHSGIHTPPVAASGV